MIDRRFSALGLDVGGWKESGKDSKLWGDRPTGSPSEPISDIRKLLQKAIDDVDDVAEHNENTLAQNKTTGKLFPKAVRSLASASQRYLGILKPIAAKTSDEKEKGIVLNTIELCEQVIEAAATLPPEKAKGKN
jgi:hypothetical protein